jgi:hypothetical protein
MIITETFDGLFDGSDVEKQLKQYLKMLKEYNDGEYYAPETKVRKRIIIPDGYNDVIKKHSPAASFWKEEWRRITHGHEGMSGLQYQYFNYYNVDGSIQFRRHDNWINTVVSECIYGSKQGTGIVTVGRRGLGKSNRFGNITINIMLVERNKNIVISSKREDDAQNIILVQKVQYAYDKLPIPMRPDILNMNKGNLMQGKWEKDAGGQKRRVGKLNNVYAYGPKVTGVEGTTLRAWLHDEAPKTENFSQFVNMSLPALRGKNGMSREGFAMFTGVAGDFGKHGDDFIGIWNDSKAMNFIKIFEPGWVSWSADTRYFDDLPKAYLGQVDAFGNEDVEANVKVILLTRHNILNNKLLTDDQKEERIKNSFQQFPLTVQEAFMSSSNSFLNLRAIEDRKVYLRDKPIMVYSGYMKKGPEGKAVFAADRSGKVKMVETPQVGCKYVAGIDAYGIKNVANTGSLGAQVIWKLKNMNLTPSELEMLEEEFLHTKDFKEKMKIRLKMGDCPVAYYMDGPSDPDDFSRQSVLLAEYFSRESNMTKPLPTLIEKEPGLIFSYYFRMAKAYLMPRPLKPGEKLTKKLHGQYGLDMKTGYFKDKRQKELVYLCNNLLDGVFFEFILDKLSDYDDENPRKKHDIVDGVGISMIAKDDYRIIKWNEDNNMGGDKAFKPFNFSRFRRK